MSGKHVTHKQVAIFMDERRKGRTQKVAAARAGFSVRTAGRIGQGEHQPNRHQPTRSTKPDPLAAVWESELVPLLHRAPALKPITLWEYLQDKHPGEYSRSVLRTLQRRVQRWRGSEGPPKEVMFPQERLPGQLGLSDFTQLKQAKVTITGKPFEHLLYHFRLAYSGWSYVMVVQSGESFAALSEGLQNALWRLGGCPKEHRTDSLSAAFRNLRPQAVADLTEAYQKLCVHYGMSPSRNNKGIAHENGAIESPHGHFKRRLVQAMLLRGSFDFATVAEYQALVDEVVERVNSLHQAEFSVERACLGPLPPDRCQDYQVLLVKVSTSSTITVRRTLYTVPSRLIGQTLRVQLYHDRLVCHLGSQPVLFLARVYPPPQTDIRPRGRCIDYRHVIDSLHTKPRAFAGCKYRDDLLPNGHYRQLWARMTEHFDRDTACRLMVAALYFAAKLDCEAAVAAYLESELNRGTLGLARLRSRFQLPITSMPPAVACEQHSLSGYDALLTSSGSWAR